MSHADPIADMLTRIRNAIRINAVQVNIKANKICEGIAKVLLEEGYITGFDRIANSNNQDTLRIDLKYGPYGEQVIHTITRCSKPSCRVYRKKDDLPVVLGGMGIAVVSTSLGVMSDHQCRQKQVGGELLCVVN
jgi:small subunit ribosomal protein S8